MSSAEPAASVVLLEFEKSYGLGFVAPSGRIVTSFHVVSDEPDILVHLSDGRTLPVKAVSALDVKRDLAVLDVGVLDATPAKPAGAALAEDGASAYVFGMVSEEGRARWVDATIAGVQELGPSLTVYRLEGELPKDASGGPLMGEDGTVLGVVTVADSDEGLVMLGIPWRYVEPLLLRDHRLPISALHDTRRKPPRREVPEHPLAMLDGSALPGLEVTVQTIAQAIQIGAPAYNEGDVETCYQTYVAAAEELVSTRDDCPGIQVALREGLGRAAAMTDADLRAWAMRDTFDGVLGVIDKYFKAHLAKPKKNGPEYLN